MSLPSEPFSLEGGDDIPVPLDAATPDDPEPLLSAEILNDAETVVRNAREAISRQDTDPAITLPVIPAHGLTQRAGSPYPLARFNGLLSRRTLTAILAMGCALAFAHGWSVGAKAVEPSPAVSCDANHCHAYPSSEEWKEEQHR
jgi:hypothetical protein